MGTTLPMLARINTKGLILGIKNMQCAWYTTNYHTNSAPNINTHSTEKPQSMRNVAKGALWRAHRRARGTLTAYPQTTNHNTPVDTETTTLPAASKAAPTEVGKLTL